MSDSQPLAALPLLRGSKHAAIVHTWPCARTAGIPGTADTSWVERSLNQATDPASERIELEARQPLSRLIGVGEVANAISHHFSLMQRSTTGVSLAADEEMQGLKNSQRYR